MYTLESCIKELDNLKIFDTTKKHNLFSIFKAIKDYENIFYQTNACFIKNNSATVIPALEGRIEHIRFQCADRAEIDIWDINPYRCQKYIIFCEGISSEKSSLLQQHAYKKFIESGWAVIAFDYRGRGQSSGSFSQKNALYDMQTIYKYLRSKRISPTDIGIIGHSMGCGVAADFCSRKKTAFTILINPFSKASDMAKMIVQKANLPELIKSCVQKLPSRLIPLQNRFDNEKALKNIKSPVLIIHTTGDNVIPIEFARILHKKNQRNNVKYIELEDCDHEINEEKIVCCLKFLEKFI